MIVGWQLATYLRTELALDALEIGLWLRQQRLDEAGAVASVGSRGDSTL